MLLHGLFHHTQDLHDLQYHLHNMYYLILSL
uniref:Uncharacterized protein n=1 Tax=Anguilla anguilla TaxID=7936 RepID=A0A0E9PHF7_ANGAN